MNGILGSISALIAGVLYLVLSFVLGWQIGSLAIWFAILALTGLTVIAVLTIFVPSNQFWLYPIMFSLPSSLVGLLAATSGSPPSFFILGVGTFLVGLPISYVVMKLRRSHISRA